MNLPSDTVYKLILQLLFFSIIFVSPDSFLSLRNRHLNKVFMLRYRRKLLSLQQIKL